MTLAKTTHTSEGVLFPTSRKAMGPPGCLGSLYDGCNDRLLGHVLLNNKEISSQMHRSKQCMIINGSRDQSENILRLVGVENELRLTISLNLEKNIGIASLIDHPFPINEYTRFFYYSYLDREEHFSDDLGKNKNFDKSRMFQTRATHIITGIHMGIDVIVVLQLPDDAETTAAIDQTLHRLRTFLLGNDNIFKLHTQEENTLKAILHTNIYSNITDLNYHTTILDICRYIKQKTKGAINHPVLYTLRPICWLHPHYNGRDATYIPLPVELNKAIEDYLIQLRAEVTEVERSINGDIKGLLCGHLSEQLSNLQKQGLNVKKWYTNEIECLSKLVIDARSGRVHVSTIDRAINNNERKSKTNSIRDLTLNFNILQEKGRFISNLTKQQFRYCNVADHNIDRADNAKTIEQKLILNDQRDCVFCSNDDLNETRPGQMNELRRAMMTELRNNPNLRLIYADFSYCSFKLQSMVRLPSRKYKNLENEPKEKGTSSSRALQTSFTSHTKAQTTISPYGKVTLTSSPGKSQSNISSSTRSETYTTPSVKEQTIVPSSKQPQPTVRFFLKPESTTLSPTRSETYIIPSIKEQNSVPSSREAQSTATYLLKPQPTDLSSTRFETHITPSTKVQTDVSSPKETQTTVSSLVKPPSIISPSTRSETDAVSSTKIQTIVPSSTDAQFIAPSITKVQTFFSPLTETHTPAAPSPTLPDNEIINILLLGETGVGKSTFINAFANYLSFGTLEQAQSHKPVVLMPVSFLVTVGDNFEEQTVKFGGLDRSNNEDFDHPGQSVTQYCKSYIFQPNDSIRNKLRIIDTPGFGDTRGLDQDDLNMQHILEYINNLSHLNAICFLLKPNASRLNIFFRSCFTQLFSLLGSNARSNIIFCFTNARSTFYTPGDTAPLLKQMLTTLSVGDVPFKKENTFCFDSESFRYLVALQNGIQFNAVEKHEYETSWSTSVTQSRSLIDYIRTKLTTYRMNVEYQSIRHAQLEISHMIRPMLEAMRNILRNLILYKINSLKTLIQLRPKVSDRSITICLSCKSDLIQIDNFWIALDFPHNVEKDCHTCRCLHNQHISIDYILDYEISNNSSRYDQNQMHEMLNRLRDTSAEFSYFLIHIVRSSNDDLFMPGLLRMIQQEIEICNSQKTNHMNSELVKKLKELKRDYEQRMNEMKSNKELDNLSDIYRRIKYIREHPLVREQMAAVKEAQKMMMKHNEYKVPKE